MLGGGTNVMGQMHDLFERPASALTKIGKNITNEVSENWYLLRYNFSFCRTALHETIEGSVTVGFVPTLRALRVRFFSPNDGVLLLRFSISPHDRDDCFFLRLLCLEEDGGRRGKGGTLSFLLMRFLPPVVLLLVSSCKFFAFFCIWSHVGSSRAQVAYLSIFDEVPFVREKK